MSRKLTPIPIYDYLPRVRRQLSSSPSNNERANNTFADINGLLRDAAYKMQDLDFYIRDPADRKQAASVIALNIWEILARPIMESFSIFEDSDKPPPHLPPPMDPLFVSNNPPPAISGDGIKVEEPETVLPPAVAAAAAEPTPPPAQAPSAPPPHRPAAAPSSPKPAKGKGKEKAAPPSPAPNTGKGKGRAKPATAPATTAPSYAQ